MFVNQENPKARPSKAYGNVIAKIAEDGVCPFCLEHIRKYHKNPLDEKKYWLITNNFYPYKPSKHHILLIHKEHITHVNEIKPEAWMELYAIFNEITTKKSINGGTLILRFGETKYTGASVSHLHAHIVQSDPDDPSYDKLKGLTMRIG